MPNHRFDNLPMDRPGNVAGKLDGVLSKHETDPENILELSRRTGSVRSALYSSALGAVIDGKAADATWFTSSTLALADGFTVALSVKLGSWLYGAAADTVPLITVQAGSGDKLLLSLDYQGKLKIEVGALSATTTTVYVLDDIVHLAIRYNHSTETFGLETQAGESISMNVSTEALTTVTAYTVELLGDSTATGDRTLSTVHCISNLVIYSSYVSSLGTVLGTRSPSGSPKHQFSLSDGGLVVADEVGTPHVLFADPAPPETLDSALVFNGRSTALRVELTLEMEQYFASPTRAVVRDTYMLMLRGKVLDLSKTQVLLDFGDLLKVTLNTSGTISATMYGRTATSTSTYSVGDTLDVFAGRLSTDSGLDYVMLYVDGTEYSTGLTATDANSAEIDYGNPPRFWVGAEEDETAATKFLGVISKFAFYKDFVSADIGPTADALVYLSDGELLDKSVHKTALWPLSHSSKSASPGYAPGPLTDGSHVASAGGHVLAEGGVVDLTAGEQRMSKKFAKDATVIRLGDKLLVSSGGKGHIVDESAETVREYGVPIPARAVATRASSIGPLSGAASYGYRFVTGEGTYSPMKRLDPVAITTGQRGRFTVGATGGDVSNLGDTAGKTHGQESGQLSTDGADPFVPGDTIAFEVAAQLEDIDPEEVFEEVWERGLEQADPKTKHLYLESGGNLNVDLDSAFTVQVSFKYQGTDSTYSNAQGIFALGRFASTNPLRSMGQKEVPGLAAWIYDGTHTVRWNAGNDTYAATVYGTAAPRLVIALGVNAYVDGTTVGGNYRNISAINDYKPLTFTDDSWTEGHDYSLFIVREGDEVVAHQYNATTDTWSTLTAQNMSAITPCLTRGGTFDAYDGTNFFEDWTYKHSGVSMTVGAAGDAASYAPPITTAGLRDVDFSSLENTGAGKYYSSNCTGYIAELMGTPSTGVLSGDNTTRCTENHFAYPMSSSANEANLFHVRVWSSNKSEGLLKQRGSRRSSARPGEDLEADIVADCACFFEDTTNDHDELSDAASVGMVWYCRKTRNVATDCTTFTQTVSYSSSFEQPIFMLADDGTARTAAPVALLYSSKGDGSIRLELAGGVAYSLAHHVDVGVGTDPLFNQRFSDYADTVNEFHGLNMYSIVVEIGTGGEYIVQGLAINGNFIFNTTMVDPDSTPAVVTDFVNDWIWLGGHADTVQNDTDCYVAEFRWWNNNFGPDPDTGTGFTNTGGRVNTQADRDNMLYYYTFQSGEFSSPSLDNQGTRTEVLTFAGASTELYDFRAADGNQYGFPEPPRTDVRAIELFRTITKGIVDPNVDEDVQNSLDAVRNSPLYFVARIPADTTYYIDITPDSSLGFGAPYVDYAVPEDIKQFFIWQGQLGVVGERNRLYYTEPGPEGWETFPYPLTYEARISGGGAGSLLAGRSAGDTLYLFGRGWAIATLGSPGNETEFPFDGGVGAYSPRCTGSVNGIVYAFNGRLWSLDRVGVVDFKIMDIGNKVQDLLPTHENVRLSISTDLQSLFIIDENTGDAVRIYLPTGEATVERRDAIAVADDADGVATWVQLNGAYSKASDAIFGDDVALTTTTHAAGSVASAVFTSGTALTSINLGMRVSVAGDSGTVDTRVVSTTGSTVVTVEDDLTSVGANPVMYFGTSSTGMLVDTGFLDSGKALAALKKCYLSLHEGTGVEVGLFASPIIGSRSATLAETQFVTVAVEDIVIGADLNGRFMQCVLRNRVPEATKISYADLEVEVPSAVPE